MILQFFILFISFICILGVFTIYAIKVGQQYQYLRLKNKMKKSDFFDIFKWGQGKPKEKQLKKEALMLFPLLFPIELENEKEELENIKKRIKKLHISLYFIIIVIMLIGVYTSKAYPNGMF